MSGAPFNNATNGGSGNNGFGTANYSNNNSYSATLFDNLLEKLSPSAGPNTVNQQSSDLNFSPVVHRLNAAAGPQDKPATSASTTDARLAQVLLQLSKIVAEKSRSEKQNGEKRLKGFETCNETVCVGIANLTKFLPIKAHRQKEPPKNTQEPPQYDVSSRARHCHPVGTNNTSSGLGMEPPKLQVLRGSTLYWRHSCDIQLLAVPKETEPEQRKFGSWTVAGVASAVTASSRDAAALMRALTLLQSYLIFDDSTTSLGHTLRQCYIQTQVTQRFDFQQRVKLIALTQRLLLQRPTEAVLGDT
ncbi:hypothetical protein EJ07DRAFT_159388 [Lizonia empirigonia]|nr:hypothetical protein EJ07DRAFT_159388 [Lizonia empirigonia]